MKLEINQSKINYGYDCTRCGKFCNSHVEVYLSEVREILKRRSKLSINDIFYPNYSTDTESSKPFLLFVNRTDGSCMFFDKHTKLCEIHKYKPIICKAFPYQVQTNINKSEIKVQIEYDSDFWYCEAKKRPIKKSERAHLNKLAAEISKIYIEHVALLEKYKIHKFDDITLEIVNDRISEQKQLELVKQRIDRTRCNRDGEEITNLGQKLLKFVREKLKSISVE